MPVPVDPYPDFVNGVTVADGDQIDARFKALYDALNPAQSGIDSSNIKDGGIASADLADGAVTSAKIADGTIALGDLASAVLNNFLKLKTSADRKVAFGFYDPPGFAGDRRVFGNIAHGLGTTPVFAVISNGYVAAANNTSSNDQSVTSVVVGLDATNISAYFLLPTGLWATVGSSRVYWLAVG